MVTVSFYEQYVSEYRSVLHLVDQILAHRKQDAVDAAPARRRLLGEDAVKAFVHVTQRMQALVLQGLLEVDVVLAALVGECCDKLTTLREQRANAGPSQDLRSQALTLPAAELFRLACQRLLKGA